jgi:pimeloyl-ACP methyl ester carboxylesterase
VPRVRFVVARSGHRLAYVDEGAGPLLVLPAWWVSHLERDAEAPAYARFFARLASRFRVVRYDRAGVGLSDRGPRTYSLDAELADLEALVDCLEAQRILLLGCSCGGPVALAYAAKHPERVERLVLYAGYLAGEALSPPDVQCALTALVRAHWGLGSVTLAQLFYPGDGEGQRRFKAIQHESADSESAARLLELTFALDVRSLVERVRVPTLVLHRKSDRVIPHAEARRLAAALPHAELVSLEGTAHMPWDGDSDAVASAVEAFCAPAGAAPTTHPSDAAELLRDGEIWTMRFAGRVARLAAGKGIADLAILLARSGEEVHVLSLLGAPDPTSGGDPALDRVALASYRRRLAEIDAELDDADHARRARLVAEREALLRRVAADTGLGGRARRLNDPVERARKTVTARIRDAIRRIEGVHPELGAHLAKTIATGVHCAYRGGVPWIVSRVPI